MTGQALRFIEPDKTWHVKCETTYKPPQIEFDYCFTPESDTLINDVHYMRLFRVENGEKTMDDEMDGILREENGIVYRYNPKDQKEYVFYDFTMNTGDTTTFTYWFVVPMYPCKCKVMVTDNLTLNDGSQARRYQILSITNYIVEERWNDVWIEGIGNLVHPLMHVMGNDIVGGKYTLMYVKRGDDVIYTHTATDMADIKAPWKDHCIYDLQGRPVRGNAQHGIYIEGGRKVWRK